MNRFFGVALIVAVLLLLVSGPALAGEIRLDKFSALIDASGAVVSDQAGPNTGWSPSGGPGEFFPYPIPGESTWWNQWFYNDPPSRERWKWIEYDIDIQADPIGGADYIEVAINWSTMLYPENPNQPPMEDPNLVFIERRSIFTGPVSDWNPEPGPIIIDEYNPEWVSIDIRMIDQVGDIDFINVFGEIRHQCVPEPSTLVLLAVAALALVFIRRR